MLISWKNHDSIALYNTIKELRIKHRLNPSNEVILELCDTIMGGRHQSNKDETVLVEYPDNFIRKMKLTGLFSIRGMGRFIDINHNESLKVEYILKNYDKIVRFKNEKAYFDYMSSIDDKLLENTTEIESFEKSYSNLKNLSKEYGFNTIKQELKLLSVCNGTSKHPVLKYI